MYIHSAHITVYNYRSRFCSQRYSFRSHFPSNSLIKSPLLISRNSNDSFKSYIPSTNEYITQQRQSHSTMVWTTQLEAWPVGHALHGTARGFNGYFISYSIPLFHFLSTPIISFLFHPIISFLFHPIISFLFHLIPVFSVSFPDYTMSIPISVEFL